MELQGPRRVEILLRLAECVSEDVCAIVLKCGINCAADSIFDYREPVSKVLPYSYFTQF